MVSVDGNGRYLRGSQGQVCKNEEQTLSLLCCWAGYSGGKMGSEKNQLILINNKNVVSLGGSLFRYTWS